ncbi:MAG: helix-turn-helix domain-containing protein [Nitrospinae bacterium]|nr:helix-turn-helix domain-containing protein [Nitrospinota bacterium]
MIDREAVLPPGTRAGTPEATDTKAIRRDMAPGAFTTRAPAAGAGHEEQGEIRMNENARNYLSTRQAAEWLGLSPRTLDRYRVTGQGPVFHRFGSRVRYLLADLEAWASARRRASTSDDGGRIA